MSNQVNLFREITHFQGTDSEIQEILDHYNGNIQRAVEATVLASSSLESNASAKGNSSRGASAEGNSSRGTSAEGNQLQSASNGNQLESEENSSQSEGIRSRRATTRNHTESIEDIPSPVNERNRPQSVRPRNWWNWFNHQVSSPEEDVEHFVEEFEEKYGTQHPVCERSGYRDATREAEAQFILIYIHAEDHDDTDKFCRDTLTDEHFVGFVSSMCKFWMTSVKSSEGYQVANQLGASRFPFMALAVVLSNSLRIVFTLTKPMSATDLVGVLERVVTPDAPVLQNHRHAMEERQAARLLREEQDREYTESLQLDQLREAQRRAEEEQMANGSLNVPSSETIGNHKEKDNNQDELAMKQSIEDKRAKLAVDVSVKGTPGTCFIKFQLSNGNRVERCFREDDTLEILRDFIDVAAYDRKLGLINYEVATNFPRRVYAIEDASMTLKEANLCPQALLYVQNLDT